MFGNKLMKKKNTIIKKYEDDAKIGEVLNYSHKSKVLNFYKGVSKEGVTNDAIVSSIDKFREKFDQFEHLLSKQRYLLGDSVTLLRYILVYLCSSLITSGVSLCISLSKN